jgi:hypothetical protein
MKKLWGWGAALAVAVGVFSLLVYGPWWFDGGHLRRTNLQPADGVIIAGFRTTLVALAAGAMAALGLRYTHRNHKLAQRQYEQTQKQFDHIRKKDQREAAITRDGQITEHYVEAVKLLASNQLTERLGGIYALKRIMHESKKEQTTVVEVLAAFVRQHAPAPVSKEHASDDDGEKAEGCEDSPRSPAEDVQAVLAVLGHRPRNKEVVNLSGTDLRGAFLFGAHLERANLFGAHLEGAKLVKARLQGANLSGAHLERANLFGAHLEGAKLVKARLQGAFLGKAHLEGAILFEAHLEGAILFEARLEGAKLDDARLQGAIVDDAQQDDARLQGAIPVKARLEDAFRDWTQEWDAGGEWEGSGAE